MCSRIGLSEVGDALQSSESTTFHSLPGSSLPPREPGPRPCHCSWDNGSAGGGPEVCGGCAFLLKQGKREMVRRVTDFSIKAVLNSSLLASYGKPPI